MEIRNFIPSDRETFLTLCHDFYDNHATLKSFDKECAEKTFDRVIENHENLWGYLLTDKESGENIGYALVTSYWCCEDGGEVIILDELYISPKSRHNGYGTKFLEFLEKEFHGRAKEITLEVLKTNQSAVSLYQKVGLVPDGFETFTKQI